MYKHCFVIAFSMATLTACEFVNGVTIQDPKISKLFATAEALCDDNELLKRTIEDLYMHYLCLLANRPSPNAPPLNDEGILATLQILINTNINQSL